MTSVAMNQLTLEWLEAGRVKQQTLTDRQPTKNSGTFRIGRDPAQCDVVVQHPTVSKLHVEVFFVPSQKAVYLRNLRATNPPLVDRQRVVQNVVALHRGTSIRLGELDLVVKNIQFAAILPPTVVAVPVAVHQAPHQVSRQVPQPVAQVPQSYRSPGVPQSQPVVELSYGLQCPKCYRVSAYEHLEIGCAWCGTSLAAAQSVLIAPGNA